MRETMEIRRSPSGSIDTQYYARNAHKLRSEAIRGAALSFARFVRNGLKFLGRRRTTSPHTPHTERVAGTAE